jgi:3-oxoacid CoA-transferase subunit A
MLEKTPEFERQMLPESWMELIPQGTLAERCRAAQAGTCFYPAGYGTEGS